VVADPLRLPFVISVKQRAPDVLTHGNFFRLDPREASLGPQVPTVTHSIRRNELTGRIAARTAPTINRSTDFGRRGSVGSDESVWRSVSLDPLQPLSGDWINSYDRVPTRGATLGKSQPFIATTLEGQKVEPV
jgi:hypothetical protein